MVAFGVFWGFRLLGFKAFGVPLNPKPQTLLVSFRVLGLLGFKAFGDLAVALALGL